MIQRHRFWWWLPVLGSLAAASCSGPSVKAPVGPSVTETSELIAEISTDDVLALSMPSPGLEFVVGYKEDALVIIDQRGEQRPIRGLFGTSGEQIVWHPNLPYLAVFEAPRTVSLIEADDTPQVIAQQTIKANYNQSEDTYSLSFAYDMLLVTRSDGSVARFTLAPEPLRVNGRKYLSKTDLFRSASLNANGRVAWIDGLDAESRIYVRDLEEDGPIEFDLPKLVEPATLVLTETSGLLAYDEEAVFVRVGAAWKQVASLTNKGVLLHHAAGSLVSLWDRERFWIIDATDGSLLREEIIPNLMGAYVSSDGKTVAISTAEKGTADAPRLHIAWHRLH